MTTARYIMIGGFLGAGKSTAVVKLAARLSGQGLRVGLITNDQGHGLVDTAFMQSHGFEVEEIAGGCFCCRFQSLREAASSLSRATCPEIFIAEPVGSCTDLIATVSYPLRRLYGDDYTIAPLSVMLDPNRAKRVLGLEEGAQFSSKVSYIYRKQIEEANVIVINKADLVEESDLSKLRSTLEETCPNAKIFTCSARDETGLDDWFSYVLLENVPDSEVMEVDYDLYAEGEALLGWLNATIDLQSPAPIDGDDFLISLAEMMRTRLADSQNEIAHLKMTLDPLDGSGELAVVNLVGNDYVPETSQSLLDPWSEGELVLNLRAEATPDRLRDVLAEALADQQNGKAGIVIRVQHIECFQPQPPVPVYRDSTAHA